MSVPATSSPGPANIALNELPTDVLNVICTWVNATDRESLIHLALAAPSLFAPAVSATLRAHAAWGLTASYRPDFGSSEIVCSTNDTFSLVGPVGQYQVGSFAAQIDETKRSVVLDKAGHPRWFLLLPQRDVNRQPFFSDLDGQMVLDGASATWSLVPIRAASLQYFTIQRNYEGNQSSRFIPPLCRSLRIIGLVSIINQIQTPIPDTVTSLMLDGCSLSMITETQQLFRVLPRALQSLSIDVMSYYHGQDSAVVLLLENLPSSLRQLSIVLNGSDLASVVWPRCHPCLVKALPNLVHLESCTLLTSTSPASLVQVVQALRHCPRLDALALRVAVFDEAEYAACEQLAQILPTGLTQLQFDVDLRHSNGEIALLRPLKFTLPPAQRDLIVSVPKWHLEMGRILPLVPTLTRLSLMADSPDVDVLFDVIGRLPATLTTLDLHEWQLHGKGVLPHLAQHMPPHLQSLQLQACTVEASDLAHLVDHWPQTLVHLDLSQDNLDALPIPLPPRLRVLNLLGNDFDGSKAATWIEALPPTLRTLKLTWTGAFNKLTPVLIDVLPPRSPHERITLVIFSRAVPARILAKLKEAFFLVDVYC